MCLAIPGLIKNIDDSGMAAVDFSGAERRVSLALVPAAREGDYVLVHAGFAIEIVAEEDARETLSLIEELAEVLSAESPTAGVAS